MSLHFGNKNFSIYNQDSIKQPLSVRWNDELSSHLWEAWREEGIKDYF